MKKPTPAELGYHMPAEWRRHQATWLSWPKDPETWPDRVPLVEEIFLQMMAALAPHETVNLLVDDAEAELRVRSRCTFPGAENIRFHQIPTVDSWIRDYGPNFLVNARGKLAYNDWIFNAWGNKYEELKQDDSIPARLESFLRVPRFEPGIVMEGGSIEVNGAGVVMTTEQCLLNPNRNPDLNRGEIEQYLKEFLGVRKVLWLGEGIVGDDTDGHIDDIARFVSRQLLSVRWRKIQLMPTTNCCKTTSNDCSMPPTPMGVPLRSSPSRCRALSAPQTIPLHVNSIDCRLVMQISTSLTTSCWLRSSVMPTTHGRWKLCNECFLIDGWSASTASHWCGAWEQFTASLSSNQLA